ncbi:F510_1955 family glycosylhydrolase [Actinotalea sp. Marseille-Q4924]|uniref:F510_1955 family glycosylhydrolase n=1 Tax=Actinotalea sp. Marseille-Q4924 TaxID=2866571 RepID=UPI001CE435D0|nr:exo-alpha-sialidase [Actinotalea sp. Marseille-Q4924]
MLHRTLTTTTTGAVVVLLLAACGSGTATPGVSPAPSEAVPPSQSSAPTATATPDADDEAGAQAGEEAPPVPGGHVHGVALEEDGVVLVATHEGVVRYGPDGMTSVGPQIDLMGFSAPEPGRLLASGHPGPGVDLPEPMGLIESTDGGQTWTVLSRGGESDFHALAAADSVVLGFDAAGLWSSTDGREWEQLDPPVAPYALAVSPDGGTVVVTHQDGPQRSADGGRTWEPVDGPLLQRVAFADHATVVGAAPDGSVHVSVDGGATWEERGSLGGPPEALDAALVDGALHVVGITGARVLLSTDGGQGFAPLTLG